MLERAITRLRLRPGNAGGQILRSQKLGFTRSRTKLQLIADLCKWYMLLAPHFSARIGTTSFVIGVIVLETIFSLLANYLPKSGVCPIVQDQWQVIDLQQFSLVLNVTETAWSEISPRLDPVTVNRSATYADVCNLRLH